MKNKRNVIIAFILICCLCLSIGYAALTDTLYVDGKASVSVLGNEEDPNTPNTPFEEDLKENVYWSAANGETNVTCSRVAEKDSGITGASDTTDSTSKPDALLITIPAGVLTAEDDSTTITATVKNDSQYDIQATLNAVAENSDYLEVTWAWANNGTGAIAEGGSANVTITVKLVKAPTTDLSNVAFSMNLTATATG